MVLKGKAYLIQVMGRRTKTNVSHLDLHCVAFCHLVIASATQRNWHSDDKVCMGRIMEATCYYHFPICPPPSEVSDKSGGASAEVSAKRQLCGDDCYVITDGECSKVYKRLLLDTQSQGNYTHQSYVYFEVNFANHFELNLKVRAYLI